MGLTKAPLDILLLLLLHCSDFSPFLQLPIEKEEGFVLAVVKISLCNKY